MRALLLVALLVGCSQPQITTGTPVEVNVHCGLDNVRIEFEGARWKFADPNEDGPPPGWPRVRQVVYLEWVDDALVAHGPEGKDWGLVEDKAPPKPNECL